MPFVNKLYLVSVTHTERETWSGFQERCGQLVCKMLLPSLVGNKIINLVLCSNVHIELDDDMIQ